MTPITYREVEIASHNAAYIANCPCPARYVSTDWEQVWRGLRANYVKELLGK
mgnify:FL=1